MGTRLLTMNLVDKEKSEQVSGAWMTATTKDGNGKVIHFERLFESTERPGEYSGWLTPGLTYSVGEHEGTRIEMVMPDRDIESRDAGRIVQQ